jgi:hypothetical protein
MNKPTDQLLHKLMFRTDGKSRKWTAWITLFVGTTLLLLSVMIWWNFREVLQKRSQNDSLSSTFLTINKQITDRNMGAANLFSEAEIDDLKKLPEVQEVGALSSNHFPVSASMGSSLGFYTQLFLEAVPEHFMDKKPKDWNWQEGDNQVPIIVSSEFLNLYNFGFAPSQGLPQLSETSIQALGFDLTIGGNTQEKYIGHVVGFSNRINSILVPESFLQYANQKFGSNAPIAPSRLILKMKDPSDPKFVQYLEQHGYTTNSEQLRWNKVRAIVQTVSLATGILAILLIAISALVFVLFIELTLAKASESIQLLRQLGYSPTRLGRYITSRFLPLILTAIAAALFIALCVQFSFSLWVQKLQLSANTLPGWPVWIVALLSCGVLITRMRMTVSRALTV